MKKNIHWFLKELDLWVQEGLINQAQAQAIRGRYPTEEEAGSWGHLAFGVSGAVLIAGGCRTGVVPLHLPQGSSRDATLAFS